MVFGLTDAIDAAGTYTIEALLRPTFGGRTLYTRRSDIPRTDLAPELPPWSSDFSVVRRRNPSAVWGVGVRLLTDGRPSTLTDTAAEGDALYVEIPGTPAGDLVLDGSTYLADGANLEVRIHDVQPIADRGTLDFDSQRPRAPRRAHLTAERPVTVEWDESSVGLPSRFVVAEVDWFNMYLASGGNWTVVMPAGERRVVYPELPVELAYALPPTHADGTDFYGRLYLLEDSFFGGYADLLAADISAELGEPTRSSDDITRIASIGISPDPVKAPVFSLVADPPASGGRVRVVAGQTLSVTAQVDGAPYPDVNWSDGTGPPTTQGATYTLQPNVPGQILGVYATAIADRGVGDELIVDVLPPDCMKLWPPLRPTTPQSSPWLPDLLHIPVAVRHDGSPVVATVSKGTFSVVAWDGTDWTDVAEPIGYDGPYIQPDGSPLALAVDDQDRPVLAYATAGGIAVARAENGIWHPFGTPIAAIVGSEMVVALDPAGNPVTAAPVTPLYPNPTPVWVWRWNGAKWVGRQAFAGEQNNSVDVRSLVMDGDVPVVSFVVSGYYKIAQGHVVRMDEQVIDLGAFDDDATAYQLPRPLLAVPRGDGPLVAWLDAVSGSTNTALEVKVSQRTVGGWEPFGVPLTLPGKVDLQIDPFALHPHALLWDDATQRAVVAFAGIGPSSAIPTVEVHDVRDGSRVCAPLLDRDPPSYNDGPARGLGMALDPTGGYVVAFAGKDNITVERVGP
jgi:hypothetical protein